MRYHLLTETLLDEIDALPREDQAMWLFLTESGEFKGRWSVDAIWPDWFLDFEHIVGQYRTIAPARLDEFLNYAEQGGYQVVFEEAPEGILSYYEHLSDTPPFQINSNLENTVNGHLPWQVTGFNKLIRNEDLRGGLVVWDTGVGKTGFIASALTWHLGYGHTFDVALVVVKKNNKYDMQKKLKQMAGVDSYIIEGPPKKRDKVYEQIQQDLEEDHIGIVTITNYEKFREDDEIFKWMVEDRDVLIFWDEMPTKLSNRSTVLYKAVKDCLWKTFEPRSGLQDAVPRAAWMRQWELSATPLENSPEGVFSTVRLMNPALLGNVKTFERDHVAYKNPISFKPERWRRLDKMKAKMEHMMHRVSMEDPEVKAMFPEIMPPDPTILIDWDSRDRALYDILTGKAAKLLEAENMFEEVNILALIQVLQMMCDAPSMLIASAENRVLWEEDEDMTITTKGSEIAQQLVFGMGKKPTDDHHTKLDTLREILQEKHPGEKALVYMTWAGYGYEPLEAKFKEWGISYAPYSGTDRQRQGAKDHFREASGPQVFLSSDKGADSIDLPEAAVGINYNLPWTWTRKRQRQGRNNRVDSKLAVTWWYDLIMADSVEERKAEIIATKHGYHKSLFDGDAIDETTSSKMSREDLIFILTGER